MASELSSTSGLLREAVAEFRAAKDAQRRATLLFARGTFASWIVHGQRRKLLLNAKGKAVHAPVSQTANLLVKDAWFEAAQVAIALAQSSFSDDEAASSAFSKDAAGLANMIWKNYGATLRHYAVQIDTGELQLDAVQGVLDKAARWAELLALPRTAGGSEIATAVGSGTVTAEGSGIVTAEGSEVVTAGGSDIATAKGSHTGVQLRQRRVKRILPNVSSFSSSASASASAPASSRGALVRVPASKRIRTTHEQSSASSGTAVPRPLAREPRPLATLRDRNVPLGSAFLKHIKLAKPVVELINGLDMEAILSLSCVKWTAITFGAGDRYAGPSAAQHGVRGMALVVNRQKGSEEGTGTELHRELSPLLDALLEHHCRGYHMEKAVLLRNTLPSLGHQAAHYDGGPSLWLPLTEAGRFINFHAVDSAGGVKRTTVWVRKGDAFLFDCAHSGGADTGEHAYGLHIELGHGGTATSFVRNERFGDRFLATLWPRLDSEEKAIVVAQTEQTAGAARAYRDMRKQVGWELAAGDHVWAHRASAVVLAGPRVNKSTMAGVLCAPPFCPRAGREVVLHNVSGPVRDMKVQQALGHCGAAKRGEQSAFIFKFDEPQVSFSFCIATNAPSDSQCAYAPVCCCTHVSRRLCMWAGRCARSPGLFSTCPAGTAKASGKSATPWPTSRSWS